jgi:hypothetical protein
MIERGELSGNGDLLGARMARRNITYRWTEKKGENKKDITCKMAMLDFIPRSHIFPLFRLSLFLALPDQISRAKFQSHQVLCFAKQKIK